MLVVLWAMEKMGGAPLKTGGLSMKTLEIDGKRSHVRHARSGDLLSAAGDTVPSGNLT